VAKRKSRSLQIALVVGLTLALGGGAIAFVRSIVGSAPGTPKKVVQEIQIIRPPPPPDVPPPPPPPPPPEQKIDVSEPSPEPDPTPSNDPPPGDQLGLDADGSAGSDAFGLEGKKGGRELLGTGGSVFTYYAGLIKDEVLAQLNSQTKLRSGNYSVQLKAWVKPDGSVERIQLAQSTGDKDRDRAIEEALSRVTHVAQAPPANMPQPIFFRFVSRI